LSSITIRDVANKAKVGLGTVSRVLNNSSSVNPETQERVLKAIEELDFVPNPIAQSLSRGTTLSVSVVLPFLTFPSFVERLRGVQSVIDSTDYDLVLYSADDNKRKNHLLQILSRKTRNDGILLISLYPDEQQVEKLKNNDVPVVLVDAVHPDLPSVYVDNKRGGKMATEHLIELGHRQIAFVSDYLVTDFRFTAMQKRFEGYREALDEASISFTPEYHREVPHDRDAAKHVALDILQLPPRPTAIFASSDTQAIGVMDAAKELHIRIPEDLSLIGFDDVRDSEYVNLTTIKQPLFSSGVTGSELLLKIISNEAEENLHIIQNLGLVNRGSTAPLHTL